ncbi:hypothetical protein B0H19DRAFT_1074758 [Mycena capillaripes]|nr:hypothetical protein B0H19DRAFT_1074758 [Mycena capillaripes]
MLVLQEGVKAMVSDSQPTYCIQGDNYFNKKVTQPVNAGSRLEDNNGPNKISAVKHTYSFYGSVSGIAPYLVDSEMVGMSGRWRNVYDGPTVRYDGVSEQEHNKVLSLACKPENGSSFLDNRPSLAIFSPLTRLKTVLMSAIVSSSILAVNLGGGGYKAAKTCICVASGLGMKREGGN